MDIQQVNSTLVKAIESFQDSELEGLVEAFMVPSPHAMHRQYGMPLPKGQFTVPTPSEVMGRSQKTSKPKVVKPKKAQVREVSQEEARAGAAKTQDQFQKIFEKLKPRQVIWVLFDSPIAKGREYIPLTVGRRSHSKKYNYTKLTLLHRSQKKAAPIGMQTRFYRRGSGEVGISLGDLAATLRGIYVP